MIVDDDENDSGTKINMRGRCHLLVRQIYIIL